MNNSINISQKRTKYLLMRIVLLICCIMSFGYSAEEEACEMKIVKKAKDVCPISVGQTLPNMVLKKNDGSELNINKAIKVKPAIIIFFRGGWCPYCNVHLGELQTIEKELVKMGYQIFAITPDKPQILDSTINKQDLNYQLLSDSKMTAAQSMGIAFKVDKTLVDKYKVSFGIDIEKDSGQKHHLLPVPSAFIVGVDGVIKFSYVNPNYKIRIDPEALLDAAKEALSTK